MRCNYPRASSRSYEGTCAVCGEPFLARHPYTLYCGPECRQEAAAERMRSRQPLPPARVERCAPEPAAPAGGIETRAWHGAPIHRRESDGWVNATAMCQAGGKRWNNYERGDRTQEYIACPSPALAHGPRGPDPLGCRTATPAHGSRLWVLNRSPLVHPPAPAGRTHARLRWPQPWPACRLRLIGSMP